jgi:hypothetical protein
MNRADELERAAAGVAGRKVIPPRDPMAAGMDIAPRPRIPLVATIALIISAAVLLGLFLSFLIGYRPAPAHIMIVAIIAAWILKPWRWRNSGRNR